MAVSAGAYVGVDLAAVVHNVRVLRAGGTRLMAVVKSNGYGCGAVEIARAAVEGGASWLGVARVEEGLDLRDAGVTTPILVLGELRPGTEAEAVRARLTPTVCTEAGVRALAGCRDAGAGPLPVHLEIDTGMHRLGVEPVAATALAAAASAAGLRVAGAWTHLAMVEAGTAEYTEHQQRLFIETVGRLRRAGQAPTLLHVANSAATLTRPDLRFDMVRPGLALHGLAPRASIATGGLRRALTWRSRVAHVKRVGTGEGVSYDHTHRLERPANIAVVPVGYGDGLPTRLGNRGHVIIGGRRRQLVGAVCMDFCLADCGDDPVRAGDEVVVVGRQGGEEVLVEELAAEAERSVYELMCGITARTPRVYER